MSFIKIICSLPTYVYSNDQEKRMVVYGGVKYCVANSIPGSKIETRLRASHEQFTLLLEFMEKYGDLSKPQPGHQGRLRCERLWQELADLLNSVGGSGGVNKTPDKWKRVWSDWKTKTKKKACIINREVHGPGGGPKAKPLNRLEERVLQIIGITSIIEHQAAEEAEFEVALDGDGNDDPQRITPFLKALRPDSAVLTRDSFDHDLTNCSIDTVADSEAGTSQHGTRRPQVSGALTSASLDPVLTTCNLPPDLIIATADHAPTPMLTRASYRQAKAAQEHMQFMNAEETQGHQQLMNKTKIQTYTQLLNIGVSQQPQFLTEEKPNNNSHILNTEVAQVGKFMNTEAPQVGKFLNTEAQQCGKFLSTETAQVGKFMNTETAQVGKFMNTQTAQVGKFMNTQTAQVGKFMNTEAPQVGKFMSTEAAQVGKFMSTEAAQVGEFLNTETPQVGKFLSTEATQVGKFMNTEAPQVGKFLSTEAQQVDKFLNTEAPHCGEFLSTEAPQVGKFMNTDTRQCGKFLSTEASQVGKFMNTEASQVGKFLNTEAAQVGKFMNTETAQAGKFFNTETPQIGKFLGTETPQVGKFLSTQATECQNFFNTDTSQCEEFLNTEVSQCGKFLSTEAPQCGKFVNTNIPQCGKFLDPGSLPDEAQLLNKETVQSHPQFLIENTQQLTSAESSQHHVQILSDQNTHIDTNILNTETAQYRGKFIAKVNPQTEIQILTSGVSQSQPTFLGEYKVLNPTELLNTEVSQNHPQVLSGENSRKDTNILNIESLQLGGKYTHVERSQKEPQVVSQSGSTCTSKRDLLKLLGMTSIQDEPQPKKAVSARSKTRTQKTAALQSSKFMEIQTKNKILCKKVVDRQKFVSKNRILNPKKYASTEVLQGIPLVLNREPTPPPILKHAKDSQRLNTEKSQSRPKLLIENNLLNLQLLNTKPSQNRPKVINPIRSNNDKLTQNETQNLNSEVAQGQSTFLIPNKLLNSPQLVITKVTPPPLQPLTKVTRSSDLLTKVSSQNETTVANTEGSERRSDFLGKSNLPVTGTQALNTIISGRRPQNLNEEKTRNDIQVLNTRPSQSSTALLKEGRPEDDVIQLVNKEGMRRRPQGLIQKKLKNRVQDSKTEVSQSRPQHSHHEKSVDSKLTSKRGSQKADGKRSESEPPSNIKKDSKDRSQKLKKQKKRSGYNHPQSLNKDGSHSHSSTDTEQKKTLQIKKEKNSLDDKHTLNKTSPKRSAQDSNLENKTQSQKTGNSRRRIKILDDEIIKPKKQFLGTETLQSDQQTADKKTAQSDTKHLNKESPESLDEEISIHDFHIVNTKITEHGAKLLNAEIFQNKAEILETEDSQRNTRIIEEAIERAKIELFGADDSQCGQQSTNNENPKNDIPSKDNSRFLSEFDSQNESHIPNAETSQRGVEFSNEGNTQNNMELLNTETPDPDPFFFNVERSEKECQLLNTKALRSGLQYLNEDNSQNAMELLNTGSAKAGPHFFNDENAQNATHLETMGFQQDPQLLNTENAGNANVLLNVETPQFNPQAVENKAQITTQPLNAESSKRDVLDLDEYNTLHYADLLSAAKTADSETATATKDVVETVGDETIPKPSDSKQPTVPEVKNDACEASTSQAASATESDKSKSEATADSKDKIDGSSSSASTSNNLTDLECHFFQSKHSRRLLMVGNIKYRINSLRPDKVRWRCSTHERFGCRARIHTVDNKIVYFVNEHITSDSKFEIDGVESVTMAKEN